METNLSTSKSAHLDYRDDWEAFEQLPKRLRWALQNATLDANSCSIAEVLEYHRASSQHENLAEIRTLIAIEKHERSELLAFGAEYEAIHGHPLPHVAAGATIQRYGRRA
jgi:hypothetical protein